MGRLFSRGCDAAKNRRGNSEIQKGLEEYTMVFIALCGHYFYVAKIQ
jgi:hypothetical protein